MFKDRTFNLSILFSSLWHLFWICVIGIVITPTVQPSNAYQEVDFLGPILEKTAFDILAEEVAPQAETLYARSTLFIDKIYLKPKGPERMIRKDRKAVVKRETVTFVLREYIRDSKEIPQYFSEDIKMIYTKPSARAVASFIEGPAGNREIIFKPEPVVVPRGLYGDDEVHRVKLRFLVSDKGIVREVEPLVSSGYPEIDLQAIKFVRGWRFSQGLTERGDKSWGIVAITVEAK